MSRPARLLFVVTTSDFGGTESFLERLLAGLDRDAFAPAVLSLRPIGQVGRRIAQTASPVGRRVPVDSLELSARIRPLETGRALASLRRRARDVDLVQTLLYRANVFGALAVRGLPKARRPVLVGSQRSLAPAGRSLDVRAQAAVRSWADATVAVSRAVTDEIQAHERVEPATLHVIPNGVDTERFRPGDAAIARSRFGLPPDRPLVGAVGRLHGPKGVPVLIEAMARLTGASDPAVSTADLVLAGDGPDAATVDAAIAHHGLGERVHRLGRVDDPAVLYPALDVYALPSLAEGSPNALLEAMACGRASVASRVGGVPEVLDARDSGLMVPPGDAEALAAALGALLGNPSRRRELGAAARERIVESFSLATMIGAHEALYARLLERPR